MKKIKISSEITYFLAIALLSLAVAILSAADFGISMIVAPAYLLSLKTGVFSFGQAEYAIQAGVFIVLCLVLRRFKLCIFPRLSPASCTVRRWICGGLSPFSTPP